MEVEATIVGTSQSSVYTDADGNKFPASKLTDGLGLDGMFKNTPLGCACALKKPGGSIEWFSLELEMPQKITRVQIANRLDVNGGRGKNVRITIGPSEAYDSIEPLCLPSIPELILQAGLQDYHCTGDLHEGKYVKISRDGTLNLCEAKVFTLQPNAGISWSIIALCCYSHRPQIFLSTGRGSIDPEAGP